MIDQKYLLSAWSIRHYMSQNGFTTFHLGLDILLFKVTFNSFKDDFDDTFITSHLARAHATCMQNFKFLAGAELLWIEINRFCY